MSGRQTYTGTSINQAACKKLLIVILTKFIILMSLYDSDSGSGLQLHARSSPGERSGKFSQNAYGKFGQNGKFSQNGKFGQNGMSGQKGKVHLGPNVSSSAHYRGCVVNGSGAMAAI